MEDWNARAENEPYAALLFGADQLAEEVFARCVASAPHGAAQGCFTQLNQEQRAFVIEHAPLSVRRFAIDQVSPEEFLVLVGLIGDIARNVNPDLAEW